MDENGNVRNSTLIIGIVVALALIALGTFVVEPLVPRFRYVSYLPALAFITIYISVHQRKAMLASRAHQNRPTDHD